MRFGIWTARWPLAGPRRALLFTGFAWLIIAVMVLRCTLASVTADVLALLVAAMVGFLAHDVAGRTEQGTRAAAGAAGPAAEADRMRAALLAVVSHDLRSPLAAAAAAVSCLRSPDLQLTAADQDELLTTAEESLDLLSRLAATLLDVTRLQAGARSVFPRPAELEEIIECSLVGLGPSGRSVRVDLPMTTHPQFRLKLEAIGFGVFIPIFFVTSGLTFDLSALFASTSTIARVPLFLLAILLARGLPALVYLRLLGLSRTLIAGILQATSLPFIVAATQIGLQLGVVSRASAAGLVAAGLLSVVISPALGLALLRREHPETATPRAQPTPIMPVLTAEDRALSRASEVKPAA